VALRITDAATSILKHTKKHKPWRKSRYGLTDEQFDPDFDIARWPLCYLRHC
jgi:hypothetical protein